MVIAGIPFTMPAVWIGLIVIFLVIEGLTAGLVTIWFAVGALAALIAAMFHAPLWLQLVWFFVISIAAFAVTRPLVKKYVNGRTQPTNADMLIGQECLVTEDIDNLTGPRRRDRRRKDLDRARTGRHPHRRRNDRHRAAHRRRQAHRHTRLRACRRK